MTDPTVIMLDEPMAGVNPALTQSLLGHVKELRTRGITVLFVEHDMEIVRRYADRVLAFYEGTVIADGHPDVALADAKVKAYIIGEHHALAAAPQTQATPLAGEG
jgi:neutral amino acid transport system ATP-binding protein